MTVLKYLFCTWMFFISVSLNATIVDTESVVKEASAITDVDASTSYAELGKTLVKESVKGSDGGFSFKMFTIPEPGSIMLVALGMLGLAISRSRKI